MSDKVPVREASYRLDTLFYGLGCWSRFRSEDFFIQSVSIENSEDDLGEKFVEVKLVAVPLAKFVDAQKCDSGGNPCT